MGSGELVEAGTRAPDPDAGPQGPLCSPFCSPATQPDPKDRFPWGPWAASPPHPPSACRAEVVHPPRSRASRGPSRGGFSPTWSPRRRAPTPHGGAVWRSRARCGRGRPRTQGLRTAAVRVLRGPGQRGPRTGAAMPSTLCREGAGPPLRFPDRPVCVGAPIPLTDTGVGICRGGTGGPQREVSAPRPPEPVAVTSVGNKWVLADVVKSRISTGHHPGLPLNPVTSVLTRDTYTGERPREGEQRRRVAATGKDTWGTAAGRGREGPSPSACGRGCPAHTEFGLWPPAPGANEFLLLAASTLAAPGS